jgi:hypothetical protein
MPKKTTSVRTKHSQKSSGPTKTASTTKAPSRQTKHDKSDKENNTVYCTGLTEDEFTRKLKKDTKHGADFTQFCYLCGRADGDTSIGVQRKGARVIACTAPIEMFSYERKVGKTTLVYNVCLECGLLLDLPTEG